MNEKGNMIKTYLVGFMDILGFKSLFMTSEFSLDKIYLSLYRMIHGIHHFTRTGLPLFYSAYNKEGEMCIDNLADQPEYVTEILNKGFSNFSDTIVMYLPVDEKNLEICVEKLKSICWLMNRFIAKSINFDESGNCHSLPIRGGVAYGEVIIQDEINFHIGKPFIDAYLLSEHQEWMGGAIHPSVPSEWIKPLVGHRNELFRCFPYIKEKCQDKYDVDCEYSLNWVKHHPSHKRWVKDMIREDGPTYKDIGCAHVYRHDWGTQIEKRKNTLQFVKTICDEFNKEAGIDCGTIEPGKC